MGQAACHPDRGIPEWTVCNPTKPDRARRSGFDYGEGGYDPNKCNVGFNEASGQFQIEIKGLVAPKSEEAQRICQQDLNEVIAAFVQDKTTIERGLFDSELVPEELTQLRMGKIIKDKYPELDEEDQEAVRQHAVAALNLTQKAKEIASDGGEVEEIITALSRIRWLFVIARNSTFTYKGRAVDVKQVGRELGVRYVLEGSVRQAGTRVRITGQLIDALTGTHLWADRFDGSLEDVFELQDKVASSVAGVIEPTLQAAETARTASRPTSDLSAYDAYLRAHAMFFTTGKQIPQALALLEEAIARDPHYGPALACAALCCMRLVSDGAATDQEANRQKGIDFAHRALEVAGNDPGALADAAMVLACFGDDIDAMMALVDRALAVNPSYARGWHVSGFLRLWAGQPGLAIEHAERALRFSPRGLTGMTSYLIGAALFFSRDFKGAVPKLRVAIEDMPVFPTPYRFIAACYAHMGLLDEARAMIARLRSITSEVTVNYPLPFRDPQHRELYFSGLRLAMGEAT